MSEATLVRLGSPYLKTQALTLARIVRDVVLYDNYYYKVWNGYAFVNCNDESFDSMVEKTEQLIKERRCIYARKYEDKQGSYLYRRLTVQIDVRDLYLSVDFKNEAHGHFLNKVQKMPKGVLRFGEHLFSIIRHMPAVYQEGVIHPNFIHYYFKSRLHDVELQGSYYIPYEIDQLINTDCSHLITQYYQLITIFTMETAHLLLLNLYMALYGRKYKPVIILDGQENNRQQFCDCIYNAFKGLVYCHSESMNRNNDLHPKLREHKYVPITIVQYEQLDDIQTHLLTMRQSKQLELELVESKSMFIMNMEKDKCHIDTNLCQCIQLPNNLDCTQMTPYLFNVVMAYGFILARSKKLA